MVCLGDMRVNTLYKGDKDNNIITHYYYYYWCSCNNNNKYSASPYSPFFCLSFCLALSQCYKNGQTRPLSSHRRRRPDTDARQCSAPSALRCVRECQQELTDHQSWRDFDPFSKGSNPGTGYRFISSLSFQTGSGHHEPSPQWVLGPSSQR